MKKYPQYSIILAVLLGLSWKFFLPHLLNYGDGVEEI